MEKLRLLVDSISATGVKGRAARKVVIVICGIKFLMINKSKYTDLTWYKITQNREAFKEGLVLLEEKRKLAIYRSSDLNEFLNSVDEVEFQKIVSSLDSIDKNTKALDLVRLFRSMANLERESGEYITNDNVLEVGIRALDIVDNSTIIDSFNGESGVIANICFIFEKENRDYSNLMFSGQEINQDSYEIGEFIAYLLLDDNFVIKQGDSIESPAFLEKNKLKMFDYAISVCPFGMRGKSDYVDKYNRFRYFKDRSIRYNNFAWALAEHVISTINSNGKAAILMPMGALFRRSTSDITVKKALVNEDIIESIIKMPSGILNYIGADTCWVIINNNKPIERKEKIQFIDLSEKVEVVGRRDKIIPEVFIEKAINDLKEMNESNESFIVSNKDVEVNQYDLNMFDIKKQKELLKNIDLDEALRLSDVATIRRGVQVTKSKLDVLNKAAEKEYYLIGLGNIVDGKIILNEEDKISAEDRWIDLYEVREGDILLTSRGSVLKVAIVEKEVKNAILSANLFLIRLNQYKYKPEILKHYLESQNGQELLYTIMKGAVIKSLSNMELEALIIPNIDIEKQCSISEMIVEAKREYDFSIKAANDKFLQKQSKIEKLLEV